MQLRQIVILLVVTFCTACVAQRYIHTPRPELMADIYAQAPALIQAALQNVGLARPLRGPADLRPDVYQPPLQQHHPQGPQHRPQTPHQIPPPPEAHRIRLPARYHTASSDNKVAAVLPPPPIEKTPESPRVIFPTRQLPRPAEKFRNSPNHRPSGRQANKSRDRTILNPSGYIYQAQRTATPTPIAKDESSISSPPLKPFSVQRIKYEFGFKPMSSESNSINNVFGSGGNPSRRQKAAPAPPVVQSKKEPEPDRSYLEQAESGVQSVKVNSNAVDELPLFKKSKEGGKVTTGLVSESKPVVTLTFDCKGGKDLGWCVLGDRYPRAEVDIVVRECEDVFDRMYVQSPPDNSFVNDTKSRFSGDAAISAPGTKIRRPYQSGTGSGRGGSGSAARSNSWSWSGYEHSPLCSSEENAIRPAFAKDVQGEWLVIVQTDAYVQTLRIDSCRNADGPCSNLKGCGVKSKCLQKHTHHRLIAIDPARPQDCPAIRLFKFPSACVCNVINEKY